MRNLSGPRQKAFATNEVCPHLHENSRNSYIKYFTGIGLQYHLVCETCAEHFQDGDILLKTISEAGFTEIEKAGYWAGVRGKPETIYKPSSLAFTHREIHLPELLSYNLLDIQPLQQAPDPIWMGLTADGRLMEINFENQTVSTIKDITSSVVNLKQPISIHIAPNGNFIAMVETLRTEGLVLDLETGRMSMSLTRDGEYSDLTPFPIAFFMHNGKPLLIHSTDWNRLDISDPQTGQLLTARGPTSYETGQPRPEHYLDYYHGRLLVSPDHEWIADDGWAWHPIGSITTWNIRRWLEENEWESEDGLSWKILTVRAYFWGGPFCWIDKHILAVWGYGQDDEWLIPAVCIFDAASGELLRWFAGTEVALNDGRGWDEKIGNYGGPLIFDKYLFACSEKYGTSIWDVDDGSCLHQDSSFYPTGYHSGSKEFLSLLLNGNFRLTKLMQNTGYS